MGRISARKGRRRSGLEEVVKVKGTMSDQRQRC
jgi:hypothetical protein